MSRVGEEMCVARSEGTGAGLFLASSLTDALQDASSSVAIQRSARSPAQGDEGIDFIVWNEVEDTCEVIRAGLDSAGMVVSSELLRSPKRSGLPPAVERDALLRELHGAGAVAALRWERRVSGKQGALLSIIMRKDRRVTIQLGRGTGR